MLESNTIFFKVRNNLLQPGVLCWQSLDISIPEAFCNYAAATHPETFSIPGVFSARKTHKNMYHNFQSLKATSLYENISLIDWFVNVD